VPLIVTTTLLVSVSMSGALARGKPLQSVRLSGSPACFTPGFQHASVLQVSASEADGCQSSKPIIQLSNLRAARTRAVRMRVRTNHSFCNFNPTRPASPEVDRARRDPAMRLSLAGLDQAVLAFCRDLTTVSCLSSSVRTLATIASKVSGSWIASSDRLLRSRPIWASLTP
jgi:hypothetical protein